jgi:hypothetical protein
MKKRKEKEKERETEERKEKLQSMDYNRVKRRRMANNIR